MSSGSNDQHEKALKIGLAHWAVTRNDTCEEAGEETKIPPALKCRWERKFRNGPGAIRTRDLLLRRQALYPTELRTLDLRVEKTRRSRRFPQPACPHSTMTRPVMNG
jgi:hypothetical protein